MSYFHIDGFLFWLLIGEFFAMLIKAMFHRTKRYFQSVRYKTKLAGGTLLVDIEADYWLKKIKDPMYRSIWRWYFGTLWNKAHPLGTQAEKRKRHRLLKIMAFIVVVLIICISLVSAFGLPSIVPAPIPVQTELHVFAAGNLTLVSHSSIVGWVYDLNGTDNSTGNYSGGLAGLGLGLLRTDMSNADSSVYFNVTSGIFDDNGTTRTYLYRATYIVLDEATQKAVQYDVYNTGGDTDFGYLLTVPAHGALTFDLFLFFRAFNSTVYSRYVTIQPAFSNYNSTVGIDGGYYHPRPYPCVAASMVIGFYNGGTPPATRC